MEIGVIGVGNILMQDEGVGPKVVEILKSSYKFEPEIEIIDGGTLGLDLLPYIEKYKKVIIVDVVDFGKEPGFIKVLKGEEIPPYLKTKLSVHHVGIQDLLEVARLLGIMPKELVLVGIQPQSIDLGLDLTPILVDKLKELINEILLILKKWGVKCVLLSHQK
ncbi:MAG: HyaD/HybD family hydrogenase maturation endopeptidase [Thermodesulfovibrio sp.]|nr:HyaD/HybD family hydrogenase maturation endopeptidase [Thermodesulfovibrio sp.]MCX7724591.1 HyaD/HybD family hydrogenase maturation endopeptidase [Thermodesulfovibrio sp.]MDW7972962.1 HyaD/HybD family hydrogenase maturation endopeptidase [Thermodesulfovibrio sp.]